VSLISQGWGDCCFLNGVKVSRINSDLTDGTKGLDLTHAKPLAENANTTFFGLSLAGAFTVEGQMAREWLLKGGNPNGCPNSDVIRPIWNGADVTRRPDDRWVIDFALMDQACASLYELPFEHVLRHVYPVRSKNNRESRARLWWRHGEARPAMRQELGGQSRFIVTSETAKHRYFVWSPASIAPEHKLVVIPRADDAMFGVLSSRIHVVWALATGSSLEDRPVYTTSRCVEPFPFPAGLTPRDTAHQRTETLEGGAIIPADLSADVSEPNSPPALVKRAQAAIKSVAHIATIATAVTAAASAKPIESETIIPAGLHEPNREAGKGQGLGAIVRSAAYGPPTPGPLSPDERNSLPPDRTTVPTNKPSVTRSTTTTRADAIQIAHTAKRLNDLRENWLNPSEWTDCVPEVTPLGMMKSPYPDRILPKLGHEKDLAERTLTKLYNQRPAWLDAAHKALDTAVAHAYGWGDYTADLPDEEILKRLLALNLERSTNHA